MTTEATPRPHDAGATLHLGGDAYCTPDLEPLLVPIDRVTLYPGNARRHDQDAITSSIRDLGVWRAAVAQTSSGHVLVGNGQHTALVELGAERVPVTWRDAPDDLARAIVVRDNRVGDLAADDDAALLDLLTKLDTENMLALAGYDETTLDDLARAVANWEFTQADHPLGTPATELADRIDTQGGDLVRVTAIVEADHRQELYGILGKLPWVRDVTDAYTKRDT